MKSTVLPLPLLLVCAAAVSLTCGGGSGVMKEVRPTGTIGLALELAPGITLEEATYTIRGPGGYERAVTIRLGTGTKLATFIGGTPPGSGYVLDVTGTSTEGSATCVGTSAPFEVVAGQTTMVNLRLQCFEQERTGNIQVGGAVNFCAAVDTLTVSTSQALVGQTIALTSATHDRTPGPGPISYQWTATTGTFEDATALHPIFLCNHAGPTTITLSVSDGDCGDSHSITVTCLAPPDAGAPDASAGGSADPCLQCVSTNSSPICSDRYQACLNLEGDAVEGPAAGAPRNGLCLNVLGCVHATRCDSGGQLRDCFCGAGVDEVTCQFAATGVCRAAFYAAGESNNNGNVMARLGDTTFALGAAADLIRECEQKPAPLCGPSCGH
jgi:hypothetical protein